MQTDSAVEQNKNIKCRISPGVYVAYIGLIRLRPSMLAVAPAMTSFPATPQSTVSLEVVRFANQYVQNL